MGIDTTYSTEDTQKGKYFTFSIESENYGIEIKYVTEIIGIQAITPMPELPDFIKGIINLRGKIIPLMDIRIRFNKEPKEYNDRTCVVVVNIKDIYLGLIVDKVNDVLSIDDENVVPLLNLKTGFGNKVIKGIGKVQKNVVLLIECENLLTVNEVEELKRKKTN